MSIFLPARIPSLGQYLQLIPHGDIIWGFRDGMHHFKLQVREPMFTCSDMNISPSVQNNNNNGNLQGDGGKGSRIMHLIHRCKESLEEHWNLRHGISNLIWFFVEEAVNHDRATWVNEIQDIQEETSARGQMWRWFSTSHSSLSRLGFCFVFILFLFFCLHLLSCSFPMLCWIYCFFLNLLPCDYWCMCLLSVR